MPDPRTNAELIRLTVAGLRLTLDAQGNGMRLALPGSHVQFAAGDRDGPEGGLVLSVREGALRETRAWRALYAPTDGWQLWRDEERRYVFVSSARMPPQRQITVDEGFGRGDVVGQSDGHGGAAIPRYPLDGIEIMLFSNWLANSGDLILHAAGIECDGQGYCFAGASGAGKSTLASALAPVPDGTVLGEDNVILRRVGDHFWIFGTPWHVNPSMCSPRGAPLAKLFFLDRTVEPGTRPCAPLDGIARLLQSAFVPYYRSAAVAAILDHLTLLAGQVPFYTLHYRLGTDAGGLLKDA